MRVTEEMAREFLMICGKALMMVVLLVLLVWMCLCL
tara:strand:+ start:204 stop:311 length:108 start_codon:yes stop_codon:yes gene_type:complete